MCTCVYANLVQIITQCKHAVHMYTHTHLVEFVFFHTEVDKVQEVETNSLEVQKKHTNELYSASHDQTLTILITAIVK